MESNHRLSLRSYHPPPFPFIQLIPWISSIVIIRMTTMMMTEHCPIVHCFRPHSAQSPHPQTVWIFHCDPNWHCDHHRYCWPFELQTDSTSTHFHHLHGFPFS